MAVLCRRLAHDLPVLITDLIFEQDSFDLLQNILEEAGELPAWTPYEDLVNTEFAVQAVR